MNCELTNENDRGAHQHILWNVKINIIYKQTDTYINIPKDNNKDRTNNTLTLYITKTRTKTKTISILGGYT